MVSTRIGSLALINDTLRDVSNSQTRLGDLQQQISSGLKSRDFAGLNGSVEQFTQVNGQIERAQQFAINNRLNISKLQTTDIALANIGELADQIKNAIVGTNGANIGTSNLAQQVTDLLASIGGELNANFNGAFIFGGTDTLNPPVPSTSVTNTANGIPDDNYYEGSKQNATLRADERTELEFPVRADDIAFQKIYAAARQAINAVNSQDTTQLQAAQQLIQDGLRDLTAVRSRLGGTVNNVQQTDARLKDLRTYWQQLSDGISKTDIVEASTEVAGYQAILQATFQVYARLSQLRLSDFLRS